MKTYETAPFRVAFALLPVEMSFEVKFEAAEAGLFSALAISLFFFSRMRFPEIFFQYLACFFLVWFTTHLEIAFLLAFALIFSLFSFRCDFTIFFHFLTVAKVCFNCSSEFRRRVFSSATLSVGAGAFAPCLAVA